MRALRRRVALGVFACVGLTALAPALIAGCKKPSLVTFSDASSPAFVDASPVPGVLAPKLEDGAAPLAVGMPFSRGGLRVSSMTVDRNFLYFTDKIGHSLVRVPLPGGEVSPVAKELSWPDSASVRDGEVMLLTDPGKREGSLVSVRPGTSSPQKVLVAERILVAFARFDSDVFALEARGAKTALLHIRPGREPVSLLEIEGAGRDLVVDASYVYIALGTAGTHPRLVRFARSSGTRSGGVHESFEWPVGAGMTRLFPTSKDPFGTGELSGKRGVFRVPRDGKAPVLLFEGAVAAASLVGSGDRLVVFDERARALVTVDLDGKTDKVLVDPELEHALTLTADASWVYVAFEADAYDAGAGGEIRKYPLR